LEELKKPPPAPEPPKKPTTRGQKQKLREKEQKYYEKEIARIEAMDTTAKAKAALKKTAAVGLEEEMERIEKMP